MYDTVTSVNVSHYRNDPDESIEDVALGRTEITELNVASCIQITDESIEARANGCPEIKVSDTKGCSGLMELNEIHFSKNSRTRRSLPISLT